jgi:peroxiredoxin (alkyl hydroperoxide reductase subunit C)
MAALAEQHQRFDKMGCEIVTVSCDTQFVHLAWKRDEGELKDVQYKMAADANGKLARMFGVYLEDAGVALRGTFLIDPEGNIMNSEVNQLNLGRNIDELMRKFKANIYLMKKTKEACPSKWQEEGDATLEPTAKMVGKVHEALRK